MSWRTLPVPTAPEAGGQSLVTGPTSGITAPPGVPTETRMTTGTAAAPHLCLRRGGTRGTAIDPAAPLTAGDTMIPSSTAPWRARLGRGEGLPGWTRTATRPLKAAPGERAATATTAARLATVQRRTTPCLRTLSGRRSGTAGPTP